jgi:putative ABC transport system permease protein
MLKDLFADLRTAVRSLRREPGFVLLAVLTLGVGVGSTATVFGMVDQLLLRPVPGVADPDRAAYVVFEPAPGEHFRYPPELNTGLNADDFDELRAGTDLLSGIAGYGNNGDWQVSADGQHTVQAFTESIYGDYFGVLGVHPSEGHLLTADESMGDPRVAVISEKLRQELFGTGGEVAGRTIQVDGQTVTVLGVAGDGFQGARRSLRAQMWVPSSALTLYNGFSTEDLRDRRFQLCQYLVARLRPGVRPEQAEAQIRPVLEGIARAHPDDDELRHVTAMLLPGLRVPPETTRYTYASLRAFAVVVGLVLLIACANVATLLLMRNVTRRGQVATRRALGASPGRIARYHLAESALLAAFGTAVGLVVAWLVAVPFAGQRVARGMPAFTGFHLDVRVLAFALVASVLTLTIFGAGPAMLAGRFDLSGALRAAGGSDTQRMAGVRRLMSAGQIAVCITLLSGAALLVRTVRNLYAIDTGISIDGLATVDIGQPANLGAPSALPDVYRDLVIATEGVSGVEGAAMDAGGPLAGASGTAIASPERPDRTTPAVVRPVTPGWFDVVRLPMVRGAPFRDGDWRPGSTPVPMVVTSALAQRVFGSTDVIGRTLLARISSDGMQEARIVGVSRDVRLPDKPDKSLDAFFVPLSSFPFKPVTLVVRAHSFDQQVGTGIRQAVQRVLPDAVPPDLVPLTAQLGNAFTAQKSLGRLLELLSVLAAILASVGLYSVIAFSVAQRRREFGIRVALGAEDSRIARMVLGDAAAIVAVGTAAGLLGAYMLSILLANRLYGIAQVDPISYAAAAALFALVAAAACWTPTRAAMRADPMEALREP